MRGLSLCQTATEKAGKQKYEIAEILQEEPASGRAKAWFKVCWARYHPSWEAWRIEGEVGSPVVTWEPNKNVMNSEAMWH